MLLLVGTHLAFAIAAFVVFGFNSYHPTDHGFALGASWRVAQGELPYRDFIWLRPPGTPYLHAFAMLLPESWTLLATRLVYYLEMTGAALLPALWALRFSRRPRSLVVASLTFLCIALHNFPAMAWYTVDAVFAASAGLAALAASITSPRRRIAWRSVASLALFAAALFKQPFAGLPVGLLVWALIEWSDGDGPERARLALASLVPGAVLWLATGLALAGAGALPDAVDQLSRASRLEDLVQAGLLAYSDTLQPGVGFMTFGGILAWGTLAPRNADRRAPLATLCFGLTFASVLWLAATPGHAGHSLFYLLLGAGLVRGGLWLRSSERWADDPSARQARARLVFHAGLLAVAWCASISWSQQTPLLGLAAAAVVLEDLVPCPKPAWLGRLGLATTALVAVGFFGFENALHPYRDAPLTRQTAALHEILPRFGRLYTHPGHAERFGDLLELIERHATNPERPFTVLRSFPAIHFLTGRSSPVRTDWYLPLEASGFQAEHRAELEQLDGIVFFQREGYVGRRPLSRRATGDCAASEFAESPNFLQAVFTAGRLLASSRAFCVVEMPGTLPPAAAHVPRRLTR
jgi:hypothetical protein